MKTQTVKEETRRRFNDCKLNVKLGKTNIIPYLSGTSNKRTMMYKEVARYEKDAEIDYELEIIEKPEYDIEIKAVRLMEQALANYQIF